MEIDEHPVPDVVVAAFCRLVDRLDAKRILGTASVMPAIFQGHRVIAQNVPVARQRIKSLLKNDRHLDTYTATLLRGTGLASEFVVVLSEAALQEGFSDLAGYFGEADFLAAALIDEREAVRDLAHEFIDGWDGQDTGGAGRAEAAESIRAAFASFLENTKGLLGDTLPPESRMDGDQGHAAKDKPDRALDLAKAELDRVTRKGERERKEFQDKITEKQKEIDRLRNDLVTYRNDSKTRDAERAQANKELTELQASLQQRIENGVDKALSSTLRQWLVPVGNVGEALAGARQSDLGVRTAEVLARQRAVDLNYGNRAALNRLIEERRQLLTEIQRARLEALNPLPELRGIAEQLEREIGDLGHRLGLPQGEIAAAAAGVLVRINEAQTLEELSEVRQFIQQTAAFELLRRDEFHRLYRAMDDKAGLLYDKAKVVGEVGAGSLKSRFFLRRAAAQGDLFTLFIDGHNVLFELEDIFGQYFVDGFPGTRARTEFGNCLTRIFDKPGADVLLYFDGDDPLQQSLSDQVRVIYSGGMGDHRADEAILRHLMVLNTSSRRQYLCLVTRDADFARQAREMDVLIIDPAEFAAAIDLGKMKNAEFMGNIQNGPAKGE